MLQTNCNSSNNNNSMDSQVDIVKRLEKLNKWQEEQKRLLNERQNMQRQMLGMEQRNMYQMLGLLHPDEDENIVNDVVDATDVVLENGDIDMQSFGNMKDVKRNNLLTDKEVTGIFSFEMLEGVTKLSTAATGKQNNLNNEREELQQHAVAAPKPKQPFLKRGEGLKQRFKISPEALRLHNLPRYKYATTHPKIKNLQRQRFVPKAKPSQEDAGLKGRKKGDEQQKSLAVALEMATPLDAQEKQFQQILINSKHAYNSTPDEKSCLSAKSTIAVAMPKVRFPTEAVPVIDGDGSDERECSAESERNKFPAITWAKVLDSQQIKPISVQAVRALPAIEAAPQHEKLMERLHITEESEDNLTIFELLERKAAEGNIDMNSSCVKRFMARKTQSKPVETEILDAIPIDRSLKEMGLRPKVEEVLRPDSSDDEFDVTHEGYSTTACDTTNDSDCLNGSAKPETSTSAGTDKTVHVHFKEKIISSTELLDSTSLEDDPSESNRRSSDLFHQFKDALFNALLGKGADGDTSTNEMRLALQSPPSALAQELQEKGNLIKTRLEELEKEIAAFKENNMQLLRAKQAHDLERAHFTQERIEVMDRLKDDKIQMEIYLHDERMKIEEEKRNFQQYMRMQRVAACHKDRKEIARLKQELEGMQLQLKQREQAHAAAQARLRVQIRNLERDQKQLYEDIERLTKENKKLQNDKTKLERDSNTRMLQEINRNIAKLTPKLMPTAAPAPETKHRSGNTTAASPPQRTSHARVKSKSHSTHKAQRKFIAPPPSRCNSKSDMHEGVEEVNNHKTEGNCSNYSFGKDYHNKHDDDSDNDDDDDDEVGFNNELEVKQTQILTKSEATQASRNCEPKTCGPTKSTETPTRVQSDASNEPNDSFRREITNADGSRDIWYPNGNLKKISADGMNIRMLYFNKDIKETNVNEGTVKYYYAETNTWHTTYLDGLEILEFPNGQTEHRYKNGMVEIHFPDNSIKVTNPAEKHKLEEWRFADGTNLIQMRNGDKILLLPNGQKEIHTKLNKRREYPDGTVKLVYPDGSQETRYSNGRVRLKDKDGNLVMDTEAA